MHTAPSITTNVSSAAGSLTQEQLRAYRETGYLHLPGLIPAVEIATLAQAIDELPLRQAALIDPLNIRFEMVPDAAGCQQVWKWDPVCDVSPAIDALVHDRRILDAVASIYGREGRLFKDKLIVKPPRSRGNALHQDYYWWQGFPTNLLTVTISIDPATRDNGCTEIYPGMHRAGLLHQPGMSTMQDDAVAGHEQQWFAAMPGDVAIFDCFTPHRAGINNTDHPRRQLFISYNDSADGDLHDAHYRHMLGYRTSHLPEAERAKHFLR